MPKIILASDLDLQYCIPGMYRENLHDQMIVNHLILLNVMFTSKREIESLQILQV